MITDKYIQFFIGVNATWKFDIILILVWFFIIWAFCNANKNVSDVLVITVDAESFSFQGMTLHEFLNNL